MENNDNAKDYANLSVAIKEAQARMAKIERDSSKLLMAIRFINRQIHDGSPWPGASVAGGLD